MSARTKRLLAEETRDVTDAMLARWQEAFGRGDLSPKDCGVMVDALLDLRIAAVEWCGERKKVKAA